MVYASQLQATLVDRFRVRVSVKLACFSEGRGIGIQAEFPHRDGHSVTTLVEAVGRGVHEQRLPGEVPLFFEIPAAELLGGNMSSREQLASHIVVGQQPVHSMQGQRGTGEGAQQVGVPVIDDQASRINFFFYNRGNLIGRKRRVCW